MWKLSLMQPRNSDQVAHLNLWMTQAQDTTLRSYSDHQTGWLSIL